MDFCLGRHSLTSTTLQTVVEHCTSYNNDPWTSPIGCDRCPACSPLANSVDANPSNAPAAYEAMEQVSFNYHLSRWRNSLLDTAEKCMIFHNLAWEKKHSTAKCPILKKLGITIKKQSAADNSNKFAACVTAESLPLPHLSHPHSSPSLQHWGGFSQHPGSLHSYY